MGTASRYSAALCVFLATSTLLAMSAGPSLAAACRDPAGFPAWLEGVKQEAISKGISERVVEETLDGISFDPGIVRKDRGQGVFRQSFEQFSGRMVPPRVGRGRALIKRYAPIFARIEERYGVTAPILVAIWGLETDFGAVTGNTPTIRAVATLAYDCRRSDMFRAELFDALRLVQRGDGTVGSLRGAWAGEIGQTQFMPSTYLKYAVDFDGSGRRDLVHSVPDVLASTANFLKNHGWQGGVGWAPGEPNFAAIQEWNKSTVYSKTIALLATRLAEGGE